MKTTVKAASITAAVIVVALIGGGIAWNSLRGEGAGGDAYAITQAKAETAASTDFSQQAKGETPEAVAAAAQSEEGIASLFPDGIEIVSPGPSRDEFDSEEEWEYYWAHFHETEVIGTKYSSMPIVRDRASRQYVPGEVSLAVDESISDQDIRATTEEVGLHVGYIARASGVSTWVKVYSDDIAANPDDIGAVFADISGFVAEGPNWAGYVLD